MQLKKTSKKKNLINEVKTFSNRYFSFNNIDGLDNTNHLAYIMCEPHLI